MTRFSIGLIAGFVASMALTPLVKSQETTGKSLGDAAREQREVHKSAQSGKTYRNEDVEPAGSGARWKSREAIAAKLSAPLLQSSKPGASETGKADRFARRSVLDHRTDEEEQDAEDRRAVPEGTELKVEIPALAEFPVKAYAARVVAPVRVSFATAIPALSMANVQIVARHYPWQGDHYRTGYFEALQVTQVVVEGVTYTVQTDRVARPWQVPSPSELTFKLLKPLAIRR
jgi:hypothetical protein